ncbi:MAG: sigma-54 dependent transcriptional regulator [Bacteroidetes bacterium]|nr:sigma-54 dependent transcriptional regulator [Bacteroidota bacterium]
MKPLKILIIEDEKLIRWSLEKHLGSKGYKVISAESGEEGIKAFEQHHPDVVFTDNRLPKMQGLEVINRIKALDEETAIVFMTAFGSIDTAVNAMKAGAWEYVHKPFSFEEIDVALDNLKKKLAIAKEVHLLRRQQKETITFDHIIGESPVLKQIIQLSKKIAKTKTTTILLLGESGTGKDIFARAIHYESSQNDRPFVNINCASLPETLLESELFGYEKGAFTDAKQQKKGLFEIADGGTVFLDEIGEVNMATQIKLLGVLENRVVRRVGGTADIPVEIRIIAATNKDLKKAVEEKKFREDLYYRLKVFQIDLPPLRDHKEDIPLLSDNFIKYYNNQFKKNVAGISQEAIGLLIQYNWPGNIRELRNVIERAIILETMTTVQAESLPGEIVHLHPIEESDKVTTPDRNFYPDITSSPFNFDIPENGFSLFRLEKQVIQKALEKAEYNQTKAAKLLGISRDTLRYKIKKYRL